MIRFCLLIVVLACSSSIGYSNTIHVPGDYSLIQEAIANAADGDTIVVAPGTYPENLVIANQKITLMSSDGPEVTIIRNENPADMPVVIFNQTPRDTILEGFTIENGTYGGINCDESLCVIRGNHITSNESSFAWNGGGIHCQGGDPIISDNIIYNNISCRGAGIYLLDGAGTIINNIFSNNYCWDSLGGAGGGLCAYYCDLVVANNIFYQNTVAVDSLDPPPFPKYPSGGGLMMRYSSGTITNCLFVENTAATGDNTYPQGCGAWVCNTVGSATMSNCIAWNNTGGKSVGNNVAVDHCLLQEFHPGTGNLTGDPHLAINGMEFRLLATSPCIDAGSNSAPGIQATDLSGMPRTLDGDGNNTSITDMGANEFLMLSADSYTLSVSAGASIDLFLDAGPDDAFRKYLIIGSVSGSTPGTPLPGGLTMPLNFDGMTYLLLGLVNTPALKDFFGFLDANGKAGAELNIGPLPPGTAGETLNFAFTCNNPFDLASHPVEFLVVP